MRDLTQEEREALDEMLADYPDWDNLLVDEVVAVVRRALSAVPRLAEGMGEERLCADCGHPEGWHTGSFSACNHPAHGCLCGGFAVVEVATPAEGDDGD